MSQENDRNGIDKKFWLQYLVLPVIVLVIVGSPWWIGDSRDGLFSTSSVPSWLEDQTEIRLHIGDRFWLDGLTGDGTSVLDGRVGLTDSTGSDKSGTKWKIHVVDEENLIINLETLGDLARDEQNVGIEGSFRWLDTGDTEGTVKLAKSPEKKGSKWKVHIVDSQDDRNIRLETLDDNNNKRWLEGITNNKKVRLAELDSNSTQWIVVPLSSNFVGG